MAPPSGGGEASLKEQKEAGLEHGDADSSGQEAGLRRSLVPGGGVWEEKGGRWPHPPAAAPAPLTRPMAGEEAVAMEPVTMGRRVGRFRKREGRSEGGPPGPSNM